MPKVSEHDREKERKGDYSEQCRIDFLIRGNTIRIYDCLEGFCKLVRAVERGRLFMRPNLLQDGRNACTGGFLLN
jgi:hypothetical protein